MSLTKIKQWLKSKLINTGLALAILGSLELNFHYLQQYIPANWYGAIFVVLGFVVIVLRIYTTVPLSEK